MREGKLPEGTGVLLAGEGGINAGLTPPPWFRFRYEEAAAQRYIPWPGHIPRWDGLNVSDTKPSPLSFYCFTGTHKWERKGLLMG